MHKPALSICSPSVLHWIPKPIIDSIHIQSLLYLLLWFGVFNYKTCRNTSKDLGHNSRTSFSKALPKVGAKAKATTPARASRKDVDKGKTKVKVDEEEALTASQTRTTRTRTRTEATPTLIRGGNSEPSGGQSGPTTRSQTHAQREQGANREHEGGDDGNAKKRSRFLRMARKLRNKGFEVTCPAEF